LVSALDFSAWFPRLHLKYDEPLTLSNLAFDFNLLRPYCEENTSRFWDMLSPFPMPSDPVQANGKVKK